MLGKQSNPFELNQVSASESAQPSQITSAAPLLKSRWFLIGLTICCVFAGISGFAFWWLTTPPPSPDCGKISPLSPDMERLHCAQLAARSGELPKVLSGLELLGQWTPDHPLHGEAQRLIAEWSEPVLAAARQKVEQSDLSGAVELASRIPTSSPLYQEAQAAIAEWKQYWQKGEAIATATRTAMKNQNWNLAEQQIWLLRDFSQDYWRIERATALSQLLSAERQGRRYLAQATEISKFGEPEQLGAAIALVSRMDPKTFVWSEAQPVLKQWSETLLSLGLSHWQKGNLDQAMALARLVSPNPKLAQTAQELLWLGQARKHALQGATTIKPTLPQLWNLTAAISTAHLIQPASRYYGQAQENLKGWQTQLQDLTLLQLAYGTGELQQPFALRFAMLQGQQVTSDRPRRAQAQTLIAYWHQEVRKLEDRPYLVAAKELAAKGAISDLQQAIAQAQLIGIERPSRKQAQTLIASWIGQIQTLEDQPILDQAWALANQGKLNEAIQIATGIAPGRALYQTAQAAMGGWQSQIRSTELARQKAHEAALEKARSQKESEESEFSDPNYPDTEPTPYPEDPTTPYSYPEYLNPSTRRPAPFPVPRNEPPPPPPSNPPPAYEPYEPVPPPPSYSR